MQHPPSDPRGNDVLRAQADGPDVTVHCALAAEWQAVHHVAARLARLAGRDERDLPDAASDFPATMRQLGGWRYVIAREGCEDLTAMVQPGLDALEHLRSVDHEADQAAEALWQSFVAARAALIAMLPPAA